MLNDILTSLQYTLDQLPLLLILFGIFVLLNVLDGHSTWLVLRPRFYHRERNPIARWIFRKLGIPRGIVIFKIVLMLILAIAFYIYSREDVFTLNIILVIANIVFIIVVWHNYGVCRKLGVKTPFDKR